jgi:hypothetical protein
LEQCIEQINEGVDPALIAIMHKLSCTLIHAIQQNSNVKVVTSQFLRNIGRFNEDEQQEDYGHSEFSAMLMSVR